MHKVLRPCVYMQDGSVLSTPAMQALHCFLPRMNSLAPVSSTLGAPDDVYAWLQIPYSTQARLALHSIEQRPCVQGLIRGVPAC